MAAVAVAALAACAAVALRARARIGTGVAWGSASSTRVVSPDELSSHGSEARRVWLSVLGSVYDVSSGEFYTSGGGYAFFAGRDATRAFTTGEFEGEGLSDDVDGLTPAQCKGLVEWRAFYEEHETYTRVGVLRGRFYDAQGSPTEALQRVHAQAAEADREDNARKERSKRFPACSSRWTKETGSVLWCEGGKVPRRDRGASKKGSARCACFEVAYTVAHPELEVFEGCEPHAEKCNLTDTTRADSD